MNASCQTAAGVGWCGGQAGARPVQEREIEREKEEIYILIGETRFCLFRHHFEAIGAFSTKGRHSNETKQSRVVRLDRCPVAGGRTSTIVSTLEMRERETRDRAMQ